MPFSRAIFGEVTPIVSSDSDATPANATVVGATEYGAGRVIFADTTLGDYFSPFTNSGKFAINIFRWVSKQPINGSHFDFLDTDGDGLENIAEAIGWDNALGRHYTNDCDPDSDDDGISDGDELRFNTDPNIPISAYSGRGDFKSYDSDFILPFLTVADWRGGQTQRWGRGATTSQSNIRGVEIKGQVWGPEVYWLPANQKPENTRIWNSMGGIEFELVTTSLIAVTGGSIDPKPLFHLFIEPKGMELPPALNENLDADVILDANWNLISSPRALAIADSHPDARGFTEETQTLWGKVGGGDPWGGSWGLGMNTNGDWEIDLGFLEFGATQPQTDPGELDFMDFADDTSVHKFGNLKVHKLSLIDFNTWAPDRLTSFNIETMLQLYQPQPQLECTELLEIELTGVVNWRLDETVVKVNYIDEKMYAVIVDSQYIAPNNSCNNYAYTILNSPNRMTQRIAQAHVEKSLTTGDNSLIAPQSAASNSSDENFKNVTVVPFDSNGDGQNDAATVTWDADTNASQADVFVIAEVQTALETVRYLDGPYTIIGTDNDAHQFNFYSLANNTHYVSVHLLEVNGHTEDRFVAMPTLVSGPGDTGSATLTALTSTITGTTAMIDWRAITTLPQENLSLVLSVMATGDAMQISKAGPYTATNSSEISGQFVFMAPGNGHYAGKLLLLDSNNKVEQEHFIPLTIGVPATTLTGNFTDTPVDKDGNGQPDALQVGAEVTFGEEGEYLLEGSLHDSSGHLMATARTVATKTVGNGQLTLTFDGLTIYHHGQNGPYTVKLALIGPNNIQVAATDNPYTTAAYALGAFGIPQAAIGNTYSASTVDNNGDGLYEELRINVLLNVSTPSTYTLSANLRGTDGDYITSASTSRPLATGAQTVSLVFKGPKLREQQINGPYILDRLTLASTDGQTLDSKRDIFTTSAYEYTTFAPISAQLSNIYSSFAWDTNNNGLYNYLALDVGVAVSVTGKYRLQGSMVTQSGQLIPWASSALYYLSPGSHIVRVPFDGINIQAINSSGTFTVTGVRLLDASNNVLAQRLEAVHTTAAYQYNLFEMGNRSATLDLLHDDMENGSDNWIADPPWRLTIFSSAANYAWSDQPGVHYQNNVNGSLTSVPVSLETLANAALSFRTKYELEPNTDFGYVEISADGGQTWAIIATLTELVIGMMKISALLHIVVNHGCKCGFELSLMSQSPPKAGILIMSKSSKLVSYLGRLQPQRPWRPIHQPLRRRRLIHHYPRIPQRLRSRPCLVIHQPPPIRLHQRQPLAQHQHRCRPCSLMQCSTRVPRVAAR